MSRQRLKVIPDRIFHKLWDKVDDFDDPEAFISEISLNTSFFNYNKYGITHEECLELLKSVYMAKNRTLKDILDEVSLKKSDISHIFCIPIRTVEDWYAGRNRTPSYIILMLLKHFHLLNLGKYVRIESMLIHARTQPAIYEKHEQIEETNREEVSVSHVIYDEKPRKTKTAADYYDEFMSGEDYEKYLDRLIADSKKSRHS